MIRPILRVYRDAYGGLSSEVWVLSIALFINRSGSMVLAFLVLYLTNRLGFSMSQAGAIFSFYGLGSITGAYLGGRLIKTIGAVRVQIGAMLFSVPLYFLVPCFSSWTGVAITVYCLSTCTESMRPANNVAVTQFAAAERQTQAFGLQRMAINLGFSIGPAVGGFLAEIDFVWLFVVDGLSTGMGGLFLLSQFGFRRYSKKGATAELQRIAESKQTGESPRKDYRFLMFLGLMLLGSLVFNQFIAIYPKYAQDHYGMTKPQIGMLYAVNTSVIVVFEMILLNFVRGFRLLPMIGWGGLLTCVGFGILPFSTAVPFIVLAMIVTTVGEMLMLPLATGYVARVSQGRDQGTYMSWYAMNFSLAAVLAPLAGSAFYELDPDLFWYLSLGIGAFVLFGFYVLEGGAVEGKAGGKKGAGDAFYPVNKGEGG